MIFKKNITINILIVFCLLNLIKYSYAFEFEKLQENRIDLNKIKLEINDKSEIKKEIIKISAEMIHDIVLEQISKILPHNDYSINLKTINIKNDIILPKGKLTYVLNKNSEFELNNKKPLYLYFYIDGECQKRIYLDLDIYISTEVIMANRNLKKDHLLEFNDLYKRKVPLKEDGSNIINNIEILLGKKLKRSITKGTIINNELIYFPPTIKKNDIVFIIADSKNIRISTLGESKRNGNIGEIIPVINLDSKKEINASIIDSKHVKVEF